MANPNMELKLQYIQMANGCSLVIGDMDLFVSITSTRTLTTSLLFIRYTRTFVTNFFFFYKRISRISFLKSNPDSKSAIKCNDAKVACFSNLFCVFFVPDLFLDFSPSLVKTP